MWYHVCLVHQSIPAQKNVKMDMSPSWEVNGCHLLLLSFCNHAQCIKGWWRRRCAVFRKSRFELKSLQWFFLAFSSAFNGNNILWATLVFLFNVGHDFDRWLPARSDEAKLSLGLSWFMSSWTQFKECFVHIGTSMPSAHSQATIHHVLAPFFDISIKRPYCYRFPWLIALTLERQ